MSAVSRIPSLRMALALLLVSTMSLAHHSFAMFENTRTETVSGTVKTFEFSYPHSWLWVTVLDASGNSQLWAFENASPAELNRLSGWTKTSVKSGDKVTVNFCPLRSGKPGGMFNSVTLPSGRVMTGLNFICGPKTAPSGKLAAPSK